MIERAERGQRERKEGSLEDSLKDMVQHVLVPVLR